MLDEVLNKLGVPPGDRNEEPAASVGAESTQAEENAVEVTTDYTCDCGCRRPILRERRAAKVERPPVAILRVDGGYDSRDAFSHCRKRGVRTTIRVRIDSNCKSDGKDRARSEAVLDQRRRRAHRRSVRQDGKGGTQEEPKGVEGRGQVQQQVDYRDHNILVQEAAGRGAPGRESKIHHDGTATKIAAYNKTLNVMREAVA